MLCTRCYSPTWLQIHAGEIRELRFRYGELNYVGAWARNPMDDYPNSDAFVCGGCEGMLLPEKTTGPYSALLHASPQIALDPKAGKTAERRRRDRIDGPAWWVQPNLELDAQPLENSTYHYEIVPVEGGRLKVVPHREELVETAQGQKLIVPQRMRAHLALKLRSLQPTGKTFVPFGVPESHQLPVEVAAKVVAAVCGRQMGYLHGEQGLVPASFSEVADQVRIQELVLHELAAFARVKLPSGEIVFLERLLPNGEQGHALESLRSAILEIQAETNAASDEQIAGELEERVGIRLTTRRVAEYRAELEDRARQALAIPLNFPEPEFNRFREWAPLSSTLRRKGISTFEKLMELGDREWEELWSQGSPEIRDLLVDLRIRMFG